MLDKLSLLLANYQVNVSPLPNVTANEGRIQAILTVVFTIIGAISLVFFVAGGLRYVSSQGDPQEIAKAKSTLIYAIIGVLVAITAVSIVTFVLGRVV